MKVLLDSVILIDHFNNIPAATAYLGEVRGEASLSVITRAEVLCGFDRASVEVASHLLDRFPTLSVDREAADLAASLRWTHHWHLPDTFQAALAQLHGLKLATRNHRDFPPERFDFVVIPYAL